MTRKSNENYNNQINKHNILIKIIHKKMMISVISNPNKKNNKKNKILIKKNKTIIKKRKKEKKIKNKRIKEIIIKNILILIKKFKLMRHILLSFKDPNSLENHPSLDH